MLQKFHGKSMYVIKVSWQKYVCYKSFMAKVCMLQKIHGKSMYVTKVSWQKYVMVDPSKNISLPPEVRVITSFGLFKVKLNRHMVQNYKSNI